jgi:hypothetical protein
VREGKLSTKTDKRSWTGEKAISITRLPFCPCLCSLGCQNVKAGPRQPGECVVESNGTKHIEWSYTLQLAYCHKAITSNWELGSVLQHIRALLASAVKWICDLTTLLYAPKALPNRHRKFCILNIVMGACSKYLKSGTHYYAFPKLQCWKLHLSSLWAVLIFVFKPRANFSLCEREKNEKCWQNFDSEASGLGATLRHRRKWEANNGMNFKEPGYNTKPFFDTYLEPMR